jgi:hypothetical protein
LGHRHGLPSVIHGLLAGWFYTAISSVGDEAHKHIKQQEIRFLYLKRSKGEKKISQHETRISTKQEYMRTTSLFVWMDSQRNSKWVFFVQN